ncbi:MAG TPA: 3-hydroxyacyl-CoA dehydrogenase family protein [Gemmatimonadales bacterium]|nr:3-hydroxyacyl-CoA dehydrogenase family protein [Gemmatimonadales bacterium]
MTSPTAPDTTWEVTVIGAGTMGHGIAYVSALAGCRVTLTDLRADALEGARTKIESLLAGGLKRGKLTEEQRAGVHERLHFEPALAAAVRHADVVIEAVIEQMPVKQRIFAEVEREGPDGALFATNTSSLSVGQIAAALKEPWRLLGMHFFNPVHLMKLVEIVTHGRTGAPQVERATALAHVLGKEPILVKDSPGFASSRLGVVLGLEAMRMLEQGVASAADIDKAMELGYNHPMGPLKLTDLVGLDVRLAIANYLHQELKLPHYAPPKILKDKVAKGDLGKKSGQGFYSWTD